MKNKLIHYILFLFIGYCHNIHGQTLPNPIRDYPLNNTSARDEANQKNGIIYGSVANYTNRFGNPYGAMRLSENTHIDTPPFFEGYNYTNGFTISFWTYIDSSISKHVGVRPWAENDPIYQAFYARKGSSLVSNTLLGFQRIRDRAVINRYTLDENRDMKDWEIWFWDPVNFTQRTGWYQIILVYERAKMTVYMFYPNGQAVSASHYFALQDLSQATSWGLGSLNTSDFPFPVMDDFKVFNQPLTREQVRLLYAREAAPNGMYEITIAKDDKRYMHTYGSSWLSPTPVEIFERVLDRTDSYRWVFEPVEGKPNVYRIRLGYNNVYLHPLNRSLVPSTSVEIYKYLPEHHKYYEWYVTAATDGYFYIQHNADRNLYLHPRTGSTNNSTPLEIYNRVNNDLPAYQWKLNLIKTRYELDEDYFHGDMFKEVVSSDNTFLTMMPTSTSTRPTLANVQRSETPSLASFWRFFKSIDDSYTIISSSGGSLNTINQNSSIGTPLEVSVNNDSRYRAWTFNKPNPFGRRYEISLAVNQSTSVSSGVPTIKGNTLKLENRTQNSTIPNNVLWQIFENGERPPANKQIYFLQPGVYKIKSMKDRNKHLFTTDFSFFNSTKIIIRNFYEERFTSFYWEVDFERDNAGNPIRDGSYLVKLFGADDRFLHTFNSSYDNGSKIEIYGLNKTYLGSYKWFVEPTQSGEGDYFIRLAGNRNLHMRLTNNSASENNSVEIYSRNGDNDLSYRWLFERVSIDAPLADGVYTFKLGSSSEQLLHPVNGSTTSATRLEIYPLKNNIDDYKWILRKTSDNSYTITYYRASHLYIHPVTGSINNSTELEIFPYVSNDSRLYKWIIEKVGTSNSYRFRLVDHPGRFIHPFNASTSSTTRLEIFEFRDNNPRIYEWVPNP